MIRFAIAALALGLGALAAPAVAAEETPAGVLELRRNVGVWDTTTEFLAEDGSVARAVRGTYSFEWVVSDSVLRGVSEIPETKQKSAILFYYRAAKDEIEMVSVGADSVLWLMTGPGGGNARTTAPRPTQDGGTITLRFTTANVTAERFESRMEWSADEGQIWNPGNRQTMVRRQPAG